MQLDHTIFNTNKPTIMIASTPRSGSTILMDYITIHDPMKRQCFLEPEYQKDANSPSIKLPNFIKHFEVSKNFIIKVHVRNLFKYPDSIKDYLVSSDDVYRVKISRSNLTDQIASYYVAIIRGKKWHYHSHDYKSEIINIDRSKINDVIKHIINANDQLENSKLKFNVVVDYEQVCNIKTTNYSFTTPKPINNDELKHHINDILRNGYH